MRQLLILRLSVAVCSYLWIQPIVGENFQVVDGECEDKQPWCKSMKKFCGDVEDMVPFCPKTCGACQKPTEQLSNGKDMIDCKRKNCDHTCEEGASGGPVCSCKLGYELQADGTTCKDIDECKIGTPCNSTDLECINNEGSFKCEKLCRKGENKYYGRDDCCAISNEQCGRNSENSAVTLKLTDDNDAIVARWPWVSLINVKSTNKNCAGVLVDRLWLIAAAHCFEKARADDVSVFFGVINSDDKSGFKSFSQRGRVEKILLHPNFKHPVNDIAMIKLTRSVDVTNYVRPSCLPQNEMPPKGQRCWAVGYAAIPRGGRVTRWIQQEAVEISDRKKCTSSRITLSEKMMCVQHGNRNSPKDCQGSTGGPLVCQRCSSCDWFVAGIATDGISCALNKSLTTFASISLHESWIRDTMGLEKLHSRTGASCQIPGKSPQRVVEWVGWGSWGECSVSCGEGNAFRTRSCSNGDPGDNGCIGKSRETRKCEMNPCSVWQSWGEWSSCSVSCRGGMRFRTRECGGPKVDPGRCGGNSRQTERCNSKPCPKWGRWSKWSQCSVTCGKGRRVAERSCVGGEVGDKGCLGRTARTKSCKQRTCPTWSNWTEWSKCSQTCGAGFRTSKRECLLRKKATNGCIGSSTRTESCTERQCQDCASWSSWSKCSATCGVGHQRRNRECTGKKTETELKEMQVCNINRCFGSWSSWSDWTKCSNTCGGGVTRRQRQCRGGPPEDCRGPSTMREVCNEQECPSTWSEWGSWGKCDAKCGGGKRRRERNCQGGKCRGKPFEEDVCFVDVDCEQIACSGISDSVELCELSVAWCTIQPHILRNRCDKTCCLEEYRLAFSDWSTWSSCTKSCGRGTQTRRRECNYPDSCAKFNGKLEDFKPCNTVACKARSVSIGCSASCGGGLLHLPCIDEECEGGNTFVVTTCNTQECPQPVSEWEEWGPCSTTCGKGVRERKRVCLESQEECNHDLVATEECHITDCGGNWSDWSDWGSCSVSCGLGMITRSKTCLEGICDGPAYQEEYCLAFECPTATSRCYDEVSMTYMCPLLTQYCDNDYMKFACRKTCRHC